MPDEISLEKMTAKERRKIKREERKRLMQERKVLLEKTKAKPCNERQSVFGGTFSQSGELEWAYYDPVGWLHRSEETLFFRRYKQCSELLTWHVASEMVTTDLGSWICQELANEKYVYCKHSGYYTKKSDAVEVYYRKDERIWESPRVVEREYRICESTKRLYPKSYVVRIRNPKKLEYVAGHLIDGKTYSRCCNCRNYFDIDSAPMRPDIGSNECASCNDIRIMGEIIHAHNYSIYPEPIFTPRKIRRMVGGEAVKDQYGATFHVSAPGSHRKCKFVDNKDLRLFGWEAETEISRKQAERLGMNRNRLAKNVIDTMGSDFVVIKEDGTLTANGHYSKQSGYSGFEIVSCPADLAAHRARVPSIQKVPGFECLRAWDEYDTCGFHVHVGRETLPPLTIGKMLMFINHKNNAKFIHRVAGRGSDRFCKYIPKEPGDNTHPAADVLYPAERVISRDEDERRNRSRRVALNLSNINTVEFRIFRGTVNPRHILRNIEFCDAVCDFCYPGSFSIQDMADYKIFIKFVESQKKKWPLLAEWLANQKIISIKKIGEKANKDRLTLNPDSVPEAERGKSVNVTPQSQQGQPELAAAAMRLAGAELEWKLTRPRRYSSGEISDHDQIF